MYFHATILLVLASLILAAPIPNLQDAGSDGLVGGVVETANGAISPVISKEILLAVLS